jgi:hypothetical protein
MRFDMPKNTKHQEVNQSAGTEAKVPCTSCKVETTHKVRASVDIRGEDWFDGNSIEYWVSHQIIECGGCETVTFRTINTHSEDYDLGPEGMKLNETVALFPSRNEGRSLAKDSHLLPAKVHRIYAETINAMNNGQPVLTGIGIRALVETICKDRSAAGSNLMTQIDSLVTLGVLTPAGAAILHKLRTLGNVAAHEAKPHAAQQLGLAMDVCEHLLQGVYILPHHAKKTFG